MERQDNSRWLMAKWVGIGLAIVGMIYVATWPADAQTPPPPKCGPAGELREVFKKEYDEEEITGGMMADDSAMFSILVSPGGETWTMIATGTNGISCIIGAGKNWFQGEIPPAGDPA